LNAEAYAYCKADVKTYFSAQTYARSSGRKAAIGAEMTAAAATLERSAGRVVPCVVAGDGGAQPGQSSPAAPSSHRLDALKRERNELRKQLSRLQEARSELEGPGLELQSLEAEAQSLERQAAEAVAFWVSGGCEGARPAIDAKWLSDIAKGREVAHAAAHANAGSIGEIEKQGVALRQQLMAIEDRIASEVAVVLATELEGELAGVRAAADEFNAAISRVMGLRSFLRPGGNYAFNLLAQKISALQNPDIGATRAEIEAAAGDWQRRVEELTAS